MGKLIRSPFPLIFLGVLLFFCMPLRAQKDVLSHEQARALDHENPTWPSVALHLPNPETASEAQLETAADVLRARRFLEDALDYYGYAIKKGGDLPSIMNKIGIVELELRHPDEARVFFQRVVKMRKKDADAWNNLGAIEYLSADFGRAISDYKRAIKLNKTDAPYHSNLATAYFDRKDFESARKEYDIALKLDPDMLSHHGTTGTTTRMLSPEDHARFCYELARLYATRGDDENMMRYLTMSSEAGFDVLREMGSDSVMGRYRKDPRILLMVKNSQEMRLNRAAVDAPQLPPLTAGKQ